MKLSKIKLLNYGVFAVRDLDFGGSSFVSIYGKNESGKSTMLQGIRESLFGFSKSTFSNGSGEISAEVCATLRDGSALSFRRKKGKKVTFLGNDDENGVELREDAWLKKLGPIDLATYANLFGFSLRELAQGQESLRHINLTNAMLGSSRSGQLDWLAIKEALNNERDQLFTSMGRTQRIPTLLKQLKETKEKIDRASVLPKDYRQLRDSDAELSKLLDDSRSDQVRLRESIAQLTVDIESYDLGKEYLRLSTLLRHQRCPEGITEDWAKTWLADSVVREKLEFELASIDAELRRIVEQIRPLETESRLLELAPTFRQLLARANSIANDEQQLDRLRTDHQLLVQEIDDRIAELSTKWQTLSLEHFSVGVEQRQELKEIAVATRELQVEQKELRRQIARILRDIERIDADALGELDASSSAEYSLINVRVQAVRNDFLNLWSSALNSMNDQVECQKLELLLRARLVCDSLDQIDRSALPDSDAIELHKRAFTKLHQDVENLSDVIQDSLQKLIELEREAQTLQAEHALPDMAGLTSLRAERDQLLQQLKSPAAKSSKRQNLLFGESGSEEQESLLGLEVHGHDLERSGDSSSPTHDGTSSKKGGLTAQQARWLRRIAELNEQLDLILDRVLQNAKAMLLHEQNRLQQEDCRAKVERLEKLRKEYQSELSDLDRRWRADWAKAGVQAGGFDTMQRWLEDYRQWQRLSTQIQLVQERTCDGLRKGLSECRGAVVLLENRWALQCDELIARLHPPLTQEVGRDFDAYIVELNTLLRQKQELAERREQSKTQKEQLQAELRSVEQNDASIQQEIDRYQKKLENWCEQLGLPSMKSAEMAEQLLDELAELRSKKFEQARLSADLGHSQSNLSRLEEEMRHALSLVGESTLEWNRLQLSHLIQQWNSRIDDAEQQIQHRDRLIVQRDERNSQRNEKQLALAKQNAKREELLSQIAGVELGEVRLLAEKAIEYWKDHEKLENLRVILESKLRIDSIELWLERISSRSLDELEKERDGLMLQLAECETIVQERTKEHGVLQQRIMDIQRQDPLSEWEQERQDFLAQLEEQSERWIVLSFASRLIEEATAEFQEKQERGLLDRAIRIFRHLTNSDYVAIRNSREDAQSFVVVDRHGIEKTPLQLSTGTREQLYLSFRLAFVEQYCESNEPLPLVLDDCFVNFDEQRLGNTLQTISELASVEQVILLSCHERTRESVRRNVPAALHLEL